MNRRDTLVALLAFGAAPLRSLAQPPVKVARVGLLGATSAASYAPQIEAMRQGFRDLGYLEGQNIVIEYRWADDHRDRLAAMAAELVQLRPDVILTSGAGTRALKAATSTIPIVMAAFGDAVASGVVASLAQPGGNITGSTFFGPEILAKRLEMLKEAAPRLARVAVLLNPEGRGNRSNFEVMKNSAAALKVRLVEVPTRSPEDFDHAFSVILKQRADGLLVPDDTMFVANMRRLGELSAVKRLPGAGSGEFALGGGLLVYGVNFPELWRRAPYFVDKILKGGRPATIPIERPTKFDLVVNLRTAKALALKLPQSILLRADRVIE